MNEGSVLTRVLQYLMRASSSSAALRKIFQDFFCCLNLVRRLLGITGKLEVAEAQGFVGASVS